jgi:hypothetical protein
MDNEGDEMVRACGTYGAEKKFVQGLGSET